MSQSNANDPTIFGDNDHWGGSFDFSGFDYLDPSNVAGPSRVYTGADVLGDFDSYPDYLTRSTGPISIGDVLYLEEGK